MKFSGLSRIFIAALAVHYLTALAPVIAETPKPKTKDKEEETVILCPFTVGPTLGVTVGGAKDVSYFRNVAKRRELPEPATITAEGLFSEHDLPLKSRNKSKGLLVLNGEAMPAKLLTLPDTRYLAQIGFSSTLNARTWQREPLNLIAVVDKSGSMSGQPMELVKDCLHKIVSQLGREDQVGIVLYGDRAHIYFEPMRVTERNRATIQEAIDGIEIDGSTNMEAGLRVGFDLARKSQKNFQGRTRLMQFTDERPNVGDTSAEGFMALMTDGSRDGIGQTTIGVGVQFDPELAAQVASVRGGNLFYFANAAEMEKTFDEELDLMVTELAHDVDLTIRSAAGLRVAEIYGVPGAMLHWDDDQTVRFHVSTLFLSKRRGAIYVALAPEKSKASVAFEDGQSLASVDLSYRVLNQETRTTSRLPLPLMTSGSASLGLVRGRLLVNEYLALKGAMTAFHVDHDREKACKLLDQLRRQLKAASDRSLRKEFQLADQLYHSVSQIPTYDKPIADYEEKPARSSRWGLN